jgi:hypothetical protein
VEKVYRDDAYYRKKSDRENKYQGDLVNDRLYKEQLYKYMSRKAHQGIGPYQVAVKDDSYFRKKSDRENKFSGNLIDNRQYREQHYRYMSRKAHQGLVTPVNPVFKDAYYRKKSNQEHQFAGDLINDRVYREQHYQYMSRHAHQYEGNIKTRTQLSKNWYYKKLSRQVHRSTGKEVSWFRYWWLKLFKKKEKLKGINNPSEKPKYDSRENEIWYY